MQKSLRLFVAASMFMLIEGVSAGVIPDGTPRSWQQNGVSVDYNDPFIAEISLAPNFNYNSENAGTWSHEEALAKLDTIYGYAMKAMGIICAIPDYRKKSSYTRLNGYGSCLLELNDGENGDDLDEEKVCADQLERNSEISAFSGSETAKGGFMAYLVHMGCFKWVRASNGKHMLIPTGIPSKRVIRELWNSFKNDIDIDEDDRRKINVSKIKASRYQKEWQRQ